MDERQNLQRLIRDLAALARARPAEALDRCRTILERWPDLVPLLVLAGRVERQMGRPEEAERLLTHALLKDPEAGPAHGELGMLAASNGEYGAAARHFVSWARCQPHLADPWFNLGLAEERRGRFEAAAKSYEKALDAAPDDDADTRLRLAGVLAMAGHEADARVQYQAVLDADAGNLDARFGLGLIDLAEGRTDIALDRFRACTERSPAFADAWQQILAMRRISDPEDPDLRVVRSLLGQTSLEPLARERLCFALGKALDDLGRYDEAFDVFDTANGLKRARLPRFDAAAWRMQTEQMGLSDPGALPGLAADEQTLPVFIVGMPRSGTTLVDQILSAHPQAAGVGELPFLDEIMAEGVTDGHSRQPPPSDRLIAVRERYMARLRKTDATAVTNKYPANFRHLTSIWRLFPNARVVHVTRSALDTCLSIFFQDFPTGNLYANSLTDIASYYRSYRRLMEQVGDRPDLLTVAYEDLLRDQEDVSRRLLAHCDLSWDPSCLDFASNRRPVGTLSRWQVRQPLYRSSLGRWRHYRDHLTPLVESLGDYADVD